MYRNSIDVIGDGVESCWNNAVKIIDAARLLKLHGHNGLCLSLSVLALEEIGKLILIDGLLFAKSNDKRSKLFEKGYRDHKNKLSALDVFPLLINYLANFDSRYNKEESFKLTLLIGIDQYKKKKLALTKWIGAKCDLQNLDTWKQKGFYTHYNAEGSFVSPTEIEQDFSDAIFQLANHIVDGVNFLLKDNIIKYKENVRLWREKLGDQQILEIHQYAKQLFNEMLIKGENSSF